MTEEETKKILNKAFVKTAFPTEYREQTLRNILNSVKMEEYMKLKLRLPDIVALIAAVMIIAVIIYGVWLPSNVLTIFS
jgi:hypothetical protein